MHNIFQRCSIPPKMPYFFKTLWVGLMRDNRSSCCLSSLWPKKKKNFQNEEWCNGVDFQATIHYEKIYINTEFDKKFHTRWCDRLLVVGKKKKILIVGLDKNQ